MSAAPHRPAGPPDTSRQGPRPSATAIISLCDTYDGYLAKAAKARAALLRTYEPRTLHAWRVNLRRITATFDDLAAALPGETQDALLDQLKQFRNATGGARDLDILLDETLPAFQNRHKLGDRIAPALLQTLNAKRVQLRHEVVEELKKARLTVPMHRFHAWADTHRGVTDDELRAAAVRLIDTRARQLRKRAARIHDGRKRLHRARTATKKLRYTIELFQPLFPREASQVWLERLAEVQTHLGEAHDRLAARVLCRELLPEARENPQLKMLRCWAKCAAADATEKAEKSLDRLWKLGHDWHP